MNATLSFYKCNYFDIALVTSIAASVNIVLSVIKDSFTFGNNVDSFSRRLGSQPDMPTLVGYLVRCVTIA